MEEPGPTGSPSNEPAPVRLLMEAVLPLLVDHVTAACTARLLRVCRGFRRALGTDPAVWAALSFRTGVARPRRSAAEFALLVAANRRRCRECAGRLRTPPGTTVCSACACHEGGFSQLVGFRRVKELTAQAGSAGGWVCSHRSIELRLRVVRRGRFRVRLVWRRDVDELLAVAARAAFRPPTTQSGGQCTHARAM